MKIALMLGLLAMAVLAGCAEDKPAASSGPATTTVGKEVAKPRSSMMGNPPAEPP